jgi:hypothetical protein
MQFIHSGCFSFMFRKLKEKNFQRQKCFSPKISPLGTLNENGNFTYSQADEK